MGMARLIVVGLIAGILAAGCGESGDDQASTGGENPDSSSVASNSEDSGSPGSESPAATTESGTIGKPAFIELGNQICTATIDAVIAKTTPVIESESKKPGYDREAVEGKLISEVMAPELRNELEELQGLGVPPGDEKQLDEIYQAIDAITARAETEAKELTDYNSKAMAKATGLAHRYGLTDCPYG